MYISTEKISQYFIKTFKDNTNKNDSLGNKKY